MQYTWPKLARFAFGGVVRPWATTFSPSAREFSNRTCQNIQPFNAQSRCLATAATSQSIPAPTQPTNSVDSGETDIVDKENFTPAEISRLAAQTVRHLVSVNNLRDAYLIVNSIRYAGVMNRTKLPGIRSMEEFRTFAHAFPPDTPPRLASHSLLHGLVRLGLYDQASKLASQMMLAGIRVRSSTLDTIVSNFVRDSKFGAGNEAIKSSPPTLAALASRKILNLGSSSTKQKETKFVLNLLMVARQARKRRTKTMLKILLALCILNGEIILASLIFGTLLRDWQARKFAQEPVENIPKPSSDSLLDICRAIDPRIASRIGSEHNYAEFGSGLQALAILANLLDQGLLDSANVAPLIKALSHCPPLGEKVWIPRPDGSSERVEAYAFFRQVLDRFIDSLSTSIPERQPPTQDTRMQQEIPISSNPISPPQLTRSIRLDTSSCNTLLHYALYVRASDNQNTNIDQAKKILHYMTSLKRRDRVTDRILNRLSELDKRKLRSDDKTTEMIPVVNLDEPQNLIDIAKKRDRYALSNYIQLLVRSGKAAIVADAVPALLPGLIQTQTQQSTADTDIQQLRLEKETDIEHAGLRRAASLGPFVFSSILNAVHKCGRTELAEKIWSWARAAENLSWEVPNSSGVLSPWCIPIQMYTTMIQVYELEARKPAVDRNNPGSVDGGTRRTTRVSLKSKLGPQIARSKAMKLYQSLTPAAQSIDKKWEVLEASGKAVIVHKGHLEVPRRDARFLNALVRVFRTRIKPSDHEPLSDKPASRRKRSFPRQDPGLMALAQDVSSMGIPFRPIHWKILLGNVQSVRIPQVRALPTKSRRLVNRFMKSRKSLPMYYRLNTWTRARQQPNL